MNIESAKYIIDKIENQKSIKETKDGQEMYLPIDAEGNRPWVAIQEWVAEGNTIAEAD